MIEVVERKKPKRGGTPTDMVRSLGLVLAGVAVVFFFAQPPKSDSARIRLVDPTGDISALRADVPGVGAPGPLPARWRPTSSRLAGPQRALNIGYVTPTDAYAEYAASTAPRADVVRELTGRGQELGPVEVAGASWEQYRDADGSLSLVRAYGATTVVVGTLRATAPLSELEVLAASLTVG